MITSPLFSFDVAGRRVFVSTGSKTQTVNVCTSENRRGAYDARYRLPAAARITGADLPELASLMALGDWLLSTRSAQLLGPSGVPVSMPNVPATAAVGPWLAAAVGMVERAIDGLVDDFVRHPYRHRVEHSLHLQLFHELVANAELDALAPIGASGPRTGLIHKEWPMPADDGERRGLFDLALLTPGQLAVASLEQFRQGRIVPPVAVELGLDYGRSHLAQDLAGLAASGVPHGYVVHFTRLAASKEKAEVEALVHAAHPNVKIAYAHVQPDGTVTVKHLDEA
ncbi:hypothetical protein I6A84_01720 [Frankia sp. CNm7]|uniref:Uncharacterized protein n=1 Tax=Frankia nepalensis TaxID=1836974 RepID=A0A937R9K3_9ACTN|nr:hypothetical protein [Frankia nepalensis]MBL7498148.1 hypothetical protein [Frankia nepalensis]MBL7509334.1 hypothetical protein [Frankia nepalensis]MBL7516878.1 hypothetical protein [Frankia nepalensis]MBL7627936.1 hypothetical protein [Frankia nepalensis]